MPVYVGERELGTKLTQFLLKATEDDEIDTSALKDFESEFLFELFAILVIGGKYNQWDSNVAPYRDALKKIYKEIVKLHKKHQKRRRHRHSLFRQFELCN